MWPYHALDVFCGGSTDGMVTFIGCFACCGGGDVVDIVMVMVVVEYCTGTKYPCRGVGCSCSN